jgi:hypothetical protein
MTLKHNIWYVDKEGQDVKMFCNETDALDCLAGLPVDEGWVVKKNMNKFLGIDMEWAD